MDINIFILSGTLVQDPVYLMRDRKDGQGQYAQACYTLANQRIAGRDGKSTESRQDITVYGKLAEEAKRCLHKGSYVTVRGALDTNGYTNRRGEEVNDPRLTVFDQDSPDIRLIREPREPENSQQLPERTEEAESYEYADQDYFQ